jgi:deoxycytidylate deaminase
MPLAKKIVTRPELVIGLVGAVGTDLGTVESVLRRKLVGIGYRVEAVRLIHLLKIFKKWESIPEIPADTYIRKSMDAGNKFRELTKRADALAGMGIFRIREIRQERGGDEEAILSDTAYLIRSLKNPAEVETLRTVYGESFILIAAYSSHTARLSYLTTRITDSHNSFSESQYRPTAEKLIQRDQEELGNKLGQNVRDTFHRADVFVDASNAIKIEQSIARFVRLFFGDPFITPTREEYCIFHAKAAALRSAEMGRQVGAVIATPEGEILSAGTNEVPKANGGFYWEGDTPDLRDFRLGFDSNDKHKKALLGDILKRLSDSHLLQKDLAQPEINLMVDDALAGKSSPLIKGAQLMNLIEFGRAVHAEMAALTNAAKLGIPVAGTTMYVTTFPCHMCARHIVAAGIKRVVYIEPYSKSLAQQLYPDSISVDSELNGSRKVMCEPFVGVGPSRYLALFKMIDERKSKNGIAKSFKGRNARPRCLSYPASYVIEELETLAILRRKVQDANLTLARSNKHGKDFIPKNSRQRRRAPTRNASTTQTVRKP